MSIKQFNASYIPNEDRLLFRFNTADESEYRFWLTRRITLFILAATDHLVEKQLEKSHPKPTAKAISEFQSESAKEKADFQTAYQSVTKFPIGADPILIADVRCTVLDINGQAVMSLDFVFVSGGNLNLKLPIPSLQSMCVLLQRLVEQARWNQGPPTIAPEAAAAMPDLPTPTPKIDPGQIH